MGIYKEINESNKITLFTFMFIIVFFLAIFRTIPIGLNIIFGLFLAIVIIVYLNERNKTTLQLEEKQRETKLDNIKPKTKHLEDHHELIDFIFSVQDFYHSNPLAFEEMIDNITSFLELYHIIKAGIKNSDYYYQIADSKKNNAVNSFHSLIHEIPYSRDVTIKFDRAHKRLEKILNNYLNEMHDVYHHEIIELGYDHEKTKINIGPKGHNHYFDKDFTYQIY